MMQQFSESLVSKGQLDLIFLWTSPKVAVKFLSPFAYPTKGTLLNLSLMRLNLFNATLEIFLDALIAICLKLSEQSKSGNKGP